jgi:hypothetical protein
MAEEPNARRTRSGEAAAAEVFAGSPTYGDLE